MTRPCVNEPTGQIRSALLRISSQSYFSNDATPRCKFTIYATNPVICWPSRRKASIGEKKLTGLEGLPISEKDSLSPRSWYANSTKWKNGINPAWHPTGRQDHQTCSRCHPECYSLILQCKLHYRKKNKKNTNKIRVIQVIFFHEYIKATIFIL